MRGRKDGKEKGKEKRKKEGTNKKKTKRLFFIHNDHIGL